MPAYGQSLTLTYIAWDTSANEGKTGDVGNHTLRWVKDGSSVTPSNSPSEVDSTNAPGVCKITLTASECSCFLGTLAGKSSTADVSIMPLTVSFEQVPVAAYVTGAVSDAGPSTTDFDTDLTEASDDHYNGGVVVFTSGNLAGQARRISDYDGTAKNLTVTPALTEAPADSDTFIILGRIET